MVFGCLCVQDIPKKSPKIRWGTPFFAHPFQPPSRKLKIVISRLLNELQISGSILIGVEHGSKGRGVQAFQFRKHDFELWVGGYGLDIYPQLEGSFRTMRTILPM